MTFSSGIYIDINNGCSSFLFEPVKNLRVPLFHLSSSYETNEEMNNTVIECWHFPYIISLKHRKPWELGKIVSTLQIRKLRPREPSWYGCVGHIEIELSWEFTSQTFCAVVVLWHQCFSAFSHPHVPNRGESGTWRLAQSGWLQACNFCRALGISSTWM